MPHVRIIAAVLSLLAATAPAAAQTWPNRPVSMVVPFAAGAASDVVGRILAARLSEILGQQIIVENVGGAGGMTGVARVAKAAPDGYQFVLGGLDTFAQNQALYKHPLYNSLTDFQPVALTVEQPLVLLVRNGLPGPDLKGFMAYSKANQANLRYGSAGVGSSSHLACAQLSVAMGVNATHIPYRGSPQAIQDLAAGRIDYFCALAAAAMPQIGKPHHESDCDHDPQSFADLSRPPHRRRARPDGFRFLLRGSAFFSPEQRPRPSRKRSTQRPLRRSTRRR